mmetsp:Transcript_11534/g.18797  ORF Transcript_11534/g.18797 Transcript_11534/m.18797 type:complete len:258 (+) Transcript_11534:139-912(+)
MAPRDMDAAYADATLQHNTLLKFLAEVPMLKRKSTTTKASPVEPKPYDDFLSFVAKIIRKPQFDEKKPSFSRRTPPKLVSPIPSPTNINAARLSSSGRSSISRSSSFSPDSPRFRQELQSVFAMFDPKNTGRVSAQSIRLALEKLGRDCKCPVVAYITSLKSDTEITFDEFFAMMSTDMALNPHDELRKVFSAFDRNGDGVLDRAELKEVLCAICDSPSVDQDVDDLLYLSDHSRKGVMSFEDFCELIMTEDEASYK